MRIESGNTMGSDYYRKNSQARQAKSKSQNADPVSSRIKNDLTEVQREKQQISSVEDLSEDEKKKIKEELKQEINSLNTQLRQRETASDREQKAKEMRSELAEEARTEKSAGNAGREDFRMPAGRADASVQETERETRGQNLEENLRGQNTDQEKIRMQDEEKNSPQAETEKKDAGAAESEEEKTDSQAMDIRSMISADLSLKQMSQSGSVIGRMERDIDILKSEISQDKARGASVEKKQAKLEEQEKKVQQAYSSRFSALGGTYKMMSQAARGKDAAGKKAEGNADSRDSIVQGTNLSKEKSGQTANAFRPSFTIYG